MLNRTGTALAAILLAAGLSACGGSSEFKTKALEMCQKSPDAATQDCACAVEIMDKELDDKTKKIFLIMADPELQKDEAKAKKDDAQETADEPKAKIKPRVAGKTPDWNEPVEW